MTRDVLLAPADNVRLVELCGPLDEHLRLIESRLGVEVRRRGNRFQLVGLAPAVKRAESVRARAARACGFRASAYRIAGIGYGRQQWRDRGGFG
jgi:phosphate starvation-inducible protein PhoH